MYFAFLIMLRLKSIICDRSYPSYFDGQLQNSRFAFSSAILFIWLNNNIIKEIRPLKKIGVLFLIPKKIIKGEGVRIILFYFCLKTEKMTL